MFGFVLTARERRVLLFLFISLFSGILIEHHSKINTVSTGSVVLSQSSSTSKININSDSIEELAGLSGIGSKKAVDIISFRKVHGDFQSFDDITKVKGIGAATVDKNRDKISFK
ncbi:MAG: ComEA family DNA-binding protein [Candidatus Omnitrophica bacterium]|nr:ComEA family DNA-binding protein [Candidatus Omnitrophota bacterium]MDD5441214.1 ComEA family DNA-binding protein [Candidatus Omnitrophota bacterium]